jgi:hypothetical protein
MSPRTPAITGALLIALLVPASAEAATIEPLKPCYVAAATPAGPQSEGVEVRAAGFTANSKVDLTLTPAGGPPSSLAGLQTDPAGNLNITADQLGAPYVAKGTTAFTITLTEQGNRANTVTAESKTTALRVTVKPRSARPSQRIRFKGSGFTDPKAVYAHYLYRNKHRKTVRMVRRPGTCGGWTAHKRQIPVNDVKLGPWTVQFDQSKRFRNAANPNSGLRGVSYRIGISVTRARPGD